MAEKKMTDKPNKTVMEVLERFETNCIAISGSTDDVDIIERDMTKLLEQAEAELNEIYKPMSEEEIRNELFDLVNALKTLKGWDRDGKIQKCANAFYPHLRVSKKHDCHETMEELRGCSICSKVVMGFRGEELDKAIEKCNWIILEQQKEIDKLKRKPHLPRLTEAEIKKILPPEKAEIVIEILKLKNCLVKVEVGEIEKIIYEHHIPIEFDKHFCPARPDWQHRLAHSIITYLEGK